MIPMLREHVIRLSNQPETLRFFCTHRGELAEFEVEHSGEQAVRFANGKRSLEEIHQILGTDEITEADLRAFYEALFAERIMRDAACGRVGGLPPEYAERLRRQLVYFAGLASESQTAWDLQHALMNSTVLIVGVGGGGSHLAVQLAGIGVGKLILVDPDHVSLENLGRQIFYAGKIGALKVEALQSFLPTLSPETSVEIASHTLEPGAPWLERFLLRADLVLNCADEPSMDQTTRWLFEACYPHRIPLIPAGGYNGHLTSVPPTLIPGRSTCWYCYEKVISHTPSPESFGLCLSEIRAGVFLPATLAMAALQMPEILRVLTRYEEPRFTNRRGEFDLSSCQFTSEEVPPDPLCGYCNGTV